MNEIEKKTDMIELKDFENRSDVASNGKKKNICIPFFLTGY